MNVLIQPVSGKIIAIDKTVSTLEQLGKEHRVLIQLVNAEVIFSSLHIHSAIEHAIRSFVQGLAITSSLNLELLLYIAGERQIHRALKKVGITKQTTDFVIIIVDEINTIEGYDGKFSTNLLDLTLKITQLKKNNHMIQGNQNTLKKFGITQKEINAIDPQQYEGLILEKVAMVDVIK